MQLDLRCFGFQLRPFSLRFLHPVFTEHPLAVQDDRADRLRIEGFGNGDQRDRLRGPIGFAARRSDPGPYLIQSFFNGHRQQSVI